MKKLLLFALLLPVFCKAQDTLYEGTIINLKLLNKLSSKTAKAGQIIEFELADNIIRGNKIIVFAGAKATGTITEASRSRSFGKEASLTFTIDYLNLPSGKVVKLRNTVSQDNNSTGGSVAKAVFVPEAYLFAGKQIKYDKGAIFKAYISNDTVVN